MKARHSSQKTALFCLKQRACLVVVLSMLMGVAAVGQVDRAVLEGTVIDPSGAAIAGAHVKILAVDTVISQEQRTNSKGYYRFPGLAVGRYTVTVSIRVSRLESSKMPHCKSARRGPWMLSLM